MKTFKTIGWCLLGTFAVLGLTTVVMTAIYAARWCQYMGLPLF